MGIQAVSSHSDFMYGWMNGWNIQNFQLLSPNKVRRLAPPIGAHAEQHQQLFSDCIFGHLQPSKIVLYHSKRHILLKLAELK